MMIDPQAKTGGLHSVQVLLGDGPVDFSWIESQISIIKSDTIAASVIKALHLTDDPEFVYDGNIYSTLAVLKHLLAWC